MAFRIYSMFIFLFRKLEHLIRSQNVHLVLRHSKKKKIHSREKSALIIKSSTAAQRADVWQVIFEVKFEVESNYKCFDVPHVT